MTGDNPPDKEKETPETKASSATEKPKANEDSKPTEATKEKFILSVQKYDNATERTSASSVITVPEKFKTQNLLELQYYLLNNNGLNKKSAQAPFCSKDGGEVGKMDTTTFNEYVTMTTQDGGDSNKFTIWYKSKKVFTGASENEQELFKQKLDLDLAKNKPELKELAVKSLTGSLVKDDWTASASLETIHPADMTEKHWTIVEQNNNLLNGNWVVYKGSTAVDVKPAYYKAFDLKKRKIPEYEVTFVRDSIENVPDVRRNERTPSSKAILVDHPQLSFRIPLFHVTDDASVDVFETKGSLANTFAKSGFTQTSAEAAASGGFCGVSAGVSVGGSTSSEAKGSSANSEESSHMHIQYNFPRVKLFLDQYSLEISEACKADIIRLEGLSTSAQREEFEQKYGSFFCKEVQLGGQLYSSQESKSIAGSSEQEKATSLKASASASISGFGAQAKASFSHEEQSAEKTTKTESSFTQNMNWNAHGGDTLLCNNPPAWCPTVASFYNWRIANRSELVPLVQLIKKMEGFSWLTTVARHYISFNLSWVKGPRTPAHFLALKTGSEAGWYGKRHVSHVSQERELRFETDDEKKFKKWATFEVLSIGHDTKLQYGDIYYLGFENQCYSLRLKPDNVLHCKYRVEPDIAVIFQAMDPKKTKDKKVIADQEEVCVDIYEKALDSSKGIRFVGSLKNAHEYAKAQKRNEEEVPTRDNVGWFTVTYPTGLD